MNPAFFSSDGIICHRLAPHALSCGLFVLLMCARTYSNDPQLKKRMDAVKTHALADLKQYGQGDMPR